MDSLRAMSLVALVILIFLVTQLLAKEHKLIPLKANCSSSQFQCPNGGCIQRDVVCNCHNDCADGADEKDCNDMLGSGFLRFYYPHYCPDGKCIQQIDICDSDAHCDDGSDEKNCSGVAPCSPLQFECSNGKCIIPIWQCDGNDNCGDESDEINCLGKCTPDDGHPPRFECNNGKCVTEYRRCDCKDDCGDWTDESNCTGRTFQCPNGTCLLYSDVCNCENDCGDWTDEDNCDGKCKRFECKNGKYINGKYECNCKDDCGDNSDEINCEGRTFQCPANGTCILNWDVCNCEDDCGDGADENNCDDHIFQCPDGSCITNSDLCDCTDDCQDGADEENCPGENRCPAKNEDYFLFWCRHSGEYIEKKDLNDGFDDCGDGSDESYCSAKPFICTNGKCFQNSSLCENAYGCANRSDGENCIGSCSEFQCPGNGSCIHNNKVCNCEDDCGDGADEKNCKGLIRKRGEANKFKSLDWLHFHCNNGDCRSSPADIVRCSAEPDCIDWSDEMDCEGDCKGFQCPSGRCIPKYFQCDGINDCGDLTDEKNCYVDCEEQYTHPVFQCTSGQCIDESSVCKGTSWWYSGSCRDGSNGENCDWRADLRCGDGNRTPHSRDIAQCNPFGEFPCCSDKGWCGNTEYHCACPDCVDYRVCTDDSTYHINNGTSICTCINGKYECKDKGCIEGSAKILDDGCNYCICNKKGTYEYCTERTCKSNKLLNTDDMSTEVYINQGDLEEDP